MSSEEIFTKCYNELFLSEPEKEKCFKHKIILVKKKGIRGEFYGCPKYSADSGCSSSNYEYKKGDVSVSWKEKLLKKLDENNITVEGKNINIQVKNMRKIMNNLNLIDPFKLENNKGDGLFGKLRCEHMFHLECISKCKTEENDEEESYLKCPICKDICFEFKPIEGKTFQFI